MLKRTPVYDFHIANNARMVDFAGWEMPIMYRSIIDEHEQTRRSGSIFDVSHMGRLSVKGADAQKLLDLVLTRKIDDQRVGQSRYSLVCNESGGVMDDVIVSRDQTHWLVVCNASNREKLLKHLSEVRQQRGFDVDVFDQTEATLMVALQGPKVIEKLSEVVDVRSLKRYHFQSTSLMMMVNFTIFRSGYTGEDGVEVILPASAAKLAMQFLASKSDNPDATIRPAGLGARDTLRLEAGMPLYGHELTEQTDPISARLGWAVDLSKSFIGADALREVKEKGPQRKLVGLEVEGRRIARQGAPLWQGEQVVGEVTSGTFGPTVQKSISMAYIDAALAAEGTQLVADLKGSLVPAKVVKLPFYKRKD
jgi:aminomethyltransferase